MTTQVKEILINENSLVETIQEAFNGFYPFLKIEFSKAFNNQDQLQKTRKILPRDSIKEITSAAMPVKLNMENKRTITQVENDCKQLLGLSVQVSRKSGNIWNLITLTDSWTLEEQNDAGKFISSEMNGSPLKG